PLDADVLVALIQRDGLLAAHAEVAVRQTARDGHRDAAVEAIALARVGRTAERAVGADLVVQDRRAVRRHGAPRDDRGTRVDARAARRARARLLRGRKSTGLTSSH